MEGHVHDYSTGGVQISVVAVVVEARVNTRMPRKAKPTKHSSAELSKRAAASLVRRWNQTHVMVLLVAAVAALRIAAERSGP